MSCFLCKLERRSSWSVILPALLAPAFWVAPATPALSWPMAAPTASTVAAPPVPSTAAAPTASTVAAPPVSSTAAVPTASTVTASMASTLAAPQAPHAFVVVLPFENTSENRSLYWVGEAIADGLSREIRQAGGQVADRRDRAALREEMGIPTLSTLTLASQIRIAERLGAACLVTGTFGVNGDALSVLARTVSVTSGRTGPWMRITGSFKDLIRIQKDIYRTIGSSLPSAPGPAPDANPTAEDGVPQAAYENLLKSFLEDSPDKRERFLRRALDNAPDYLRAKIELAQIYRDSNQLTKAVQTLSNLATRDRSLAAEGENLLADIEMEQGHATASEAALRRSLALGETARAHLLLARLAVSRGDRASAVAELARSRQLDPTDPDLAEVEESLSPAQ